MSYAKLAKLTYQEAIEKLAIDIATMKFQLDLVESKISLDGNIEGSIRAIVDIYDGTYPVVKERLNRRIDAYYKRFVSRGHVTLEA